MKITKAQLKSLIREEIESTLTEETITEVFGPDFAGGDLGLIGLKKKYPQEAAALEKKGLLDRYFVAAKAVLQKSKGENVLSPSQYLREPDKVDVYLGIKSQEAPAPAPSSGGKQAVTSNIKKMYDDLRTYDTKFQKDPELRKKYEAALGAINSLLRGL